MLYWHKLMHLMPVPCDCQFDACRSPCSARRLHWIRVDPTPLVFTGVSGDRSVPTAARGRIAVQARRTMLVAGTWRVRWGLVTWWFTGVSEGICWFSADESLWE